MRTWALSLLAGTACALPGVALPGRVELGGGAMAGHAQHREEGVLVEREPDQLMRFRGTLHILQAIPPLRDRAFDLGPGYVMEIFSPGNAFLYHGLHLEGIYYLRNLTGEAGRQRVGVLVDPELLIDDLRGTSELGWGLTSGVIIELVGMDWGAGAYLPGGVIAPFGFGAMIGEYGIGLTATTSLRHLGDSTYVAALVGLSIRLPLGAGLAGVAVKKSMVAIPF